jgi:hypothetical protein
VGLYRNLRAGHLFPNAARAAGYSAIEQMQTELKIDLEQYLQQKHVKFNFESTRLQTALNQAQKRWNSLIDDYTNKTSNTASQLGFCSCQEHQTLNAAALPYWVTPAGFMRRILGLSQDFVYHILNLGLYLAAIQNHAYALQWTMHQDDRLCPTCLTYGTGGDHGIYRLNEFRPEPPPVHPGCRCQYQIILKT